MPHAFHRSDPPDIYLLQDQSVKRRTSVLRISRSYCRSEKRADHNPGYRLKNATSKKKKKKKEAVVPGFQLVLDRRSSESTEYYTVYIAFSRRIP